jgi:hypothetical protein
MANTYSSTPVLSKVKIGSDTYYMKDADVRAIIDEYGNIVTYNVEATLTNGDNIPTGAAVVKAIENGVSSIAGAMHFIGVKDSVPATYDGAAGDLILVGTKEYVYDGEKFVELGDEAIYLTTASAETNYVQKTFTIAGIDMQDAITAAEIKTALGLKALAYKDSASATLTDYAIGISGATYTPAGDVGVTLNQTSTAITSSGSFTPKGTVAGSVTAAGTVTLAKSDNGVAVSGTCSTPTITVTPKTASVQHLKSVGTLPSYSAARYTAPSVSETTSTFATSGVTATVGSGDDAETLIIGTAGTASALTSTGFKAGSFTDGTFSAGSLPELDTAQTVVTGIQSATASAITFTGDKFGATFSGSSTDITADFTGTAGSVSVSGNYDKATVGSTSFTGTEAIIKPTLTTGSKTVTVQ